MEHLCPRLTNLADILATQLHDVPSVEAYCEQLSLISWQTSDPDVRKLLEFEVSPHGFRQYFRLVRLLLEEKFTQELFNAKTQEIAARPCLRCRCQRQSGAPFAWKNAFQVDDNKYKKAALWAMECFKSTFGDWTYDEMSEWWEADKWAFLQTFGSANRCTTCGTDLGEGNPNHLCDICKSMK